ncbi:ATP-grasp domain-containing protein [Fructilactobacillus hinvesii]|uniref:ATP-grasp domain-containing protein n=1 Tax=Fructilactobacillus hinvesii TaxID=2940300 RepID=A0ABY5BTQ4_9LACO|nr:ATP-grasp domain-containing protein [Fructilactobacillus hinvesii]USS88497.1 ATP-grasp domain-containing protein [Fructilactobacillus hinvesii]
MKPFNPGMTLGIIGKGYQLQQLADAARRTELKVLLYPNPTAENPHSLTDAGLLHAFAEQSDVTTAIAEPVPLSSLETISTGSEFPQGTELTEISQDRALEQAFFQSLNLNGVPFSTVINTSDVEQGIDTLGLPARIIPISKRSANQQPLDLKTKDDVAKFISLAGRGSYLFVPDLPVKHHLVASATKSVQGKIESFPLVQINQQGRSFTSLTEDTKLISPEVQTEIEKTMQKIGEALHVVGNFAVSLLVTTTDILYVQGLLPALDLPVNVLQRGLNTTPADQHLRAIRGLPLTPIHQFQSERWLSLTKPQLEAALEAQRQHPDWDFDFSYRDDHPEILGDVWIPVDEPALTNERIQRARLLPHEE